jgi:hypothetical protein
MQIAKPVPGILPPAKLETTFREVIYRDIPVSTSRKFPTGIKSRWKVATFITVGLKS